MLLEVPACGHEICHVRREVGIGEIPVALPQAGEVEPQYSEPPIRQGPTDGNHGLELLRACEAMGEEHVPLGGIADGELQTGGKLLTRGAGEGEGLGGHDAFSGWVLEVGWRPGVERLSWTTVPGSREFRGRAESRPPGEARKEFTRPG